MTRKQATSSGETRMHSFPLVLGDWGAVLREDQATSAEKLCALAQLGDGPAVLDIIRQLLCDSDHAAALLGLAASLNNSLGRCALLTSDDANARTHFERSLGYAFEGDRISSIEVEARRVEQSRQLGIIGVWSPGKGRSGHLGAEAALATLADLAPDDPFLALALAERAQMNSNYSMAIRQWQSVAAMLGSRMPQVYYQRLRQAYGAIDAFPQGTPEEEALRGKIEKTVLLKALHDLLVPDLYLEIGVQHGNSFNLARGGAIGVDPMAALHEPLAPGAKLFTMSSDTFFATEARALLDPPPGLVFIDGMHLAEFALRDFINVERHSSPETIVVLDDIFPNHPAQAARDRRTRAWTGDVWRLYLTLKTIRPDLNLHVADAYPTGLLIVTGLDSSNTLLMRHYDEFAAASQIDQSVPVDILSRADAPIKSVDSLRESLERAGVRLRGMA